MTASLLRRAAPWQFSMAQLLGATTLICLAFGLLRQLALADRAGLLLAQVGIAAVSAVLSAIYGLRVSGHAVAQTGAGRWHFSVGQFFAAVGLLGIAVGLSRSYLEHPEIVQLLITGMLAILAFCSTVAVLFGGPLLLTLVVATAVPDRQRCGLCAMLAVTAVYGLAFWVLVLNQ